MTTLYWLRYGFLLLLLVVALWVTWLATGGPPRRSRSR
jgi:hypothetical protein